jgi:phage baseplate assembly protein gpV
MLHVLTPSTVLTKQLKVLKNIANLGGALASNGLTRIALQHQVAQK